VPSPDYTRTGFTYSPALSAPVVGMVGGQDMTVWSDQNLTPAGTGALIQSIFRLPANAFSYTGQYIYVMAAATTAANTNSKTLTLNWGGTGVVGGAVTGGTTIATIATTTSAAALVAYAYIYKMGANSQQCWGFTQTGTALTAPSVNATTATDTAAIQLNLVVNNATTAGDSTVQFYIVQFYS